jgi:hypothetical protein
MHSLGPVGRRISGLSGTANADLETWPTPDEGALEGDQLTQYLDRKQGVRMYLMGESDKAIRKRCGVGIKQIYRLIRERCMEPHADGRIYGWRGLVPGSRIKPYIRKKPIRVDPFGCGAAGAMRAVLDLLPTLRAKFEKRILDAPGGNDLGAAKRPRQAHWKWFLDELRKLGYEQRKEWPFNTSSNGYSSVCRFIDDVYAANPKKAARVIGGPELEKKLTTGDGVDRPVQNAFKRVEMDAHKLDGRFCVLIPQIDGGHRAKIVHRIWVIVILEVVSRAVLGYHLSFGREVSKEDVMRTIKKALTRWYQRTLACGETKYAEGAALPSAVSDELLGVCWDETSVDGALAETCAHVRRILKDVVESILLTPAEGFASRRSKDDRPFIETFFRNLGSAGFQRLTNTTGGKPSGKQGRDPEAIAVTSQFQLEYAEDLLDVLIANYNATPHTSLGYRSPLEYLEFVRSRPGTELRYADPSAVEGILSYRKKCCVKGGLEQGRRPYVNFEGARYTNETLAQRFDLVGKFIWVVNHLEDDARVVLASTLDGQNLGVLRAQSPWHKFPHSLRIRRAINSGARRRMFFIASGADAVETFIEFCEAQSDRKLPIHPAYLELRRILAQQSDSNIGQATLDQAMEKADDGILLESGDRQAKASQQRGPSNTSTQKLPLRRIAASD